MTTRTDDRKVRNDERVSPEERPRTELFVRSIPPEITSEQLSEFFSDFAPVKHSIVVMDKDTGESKRFGFVAFATPEDAVSAKAEGIKTAIQPGRYLQIDIAKPRQRDEKKASFVNEYGDSDKEKRRPRLLIRNCPWSLRDPKELVKIFSKFGKVVDAYIPRGPNQRMSGFAFVTMKRKKHAKRAIEESKGLRIHDREVNISLALEKSKWVNRGQDGDTTKELEDESESESESENEDEDVSKKKSLKRPLHERDEIGLDEGAEEEDEEEEDSGEEDAMESEDDAEDDENAHDDDDNDDDDDDEKEEEEEEETEPKHRLPKLGENQSIFVRNVPYDATSESLKEHFSQFGPVAYALPVMDKEKNQPKGTAFVAFKHLATCEACAASAPEITPGSLIVPDDVDSRYVYEGRVLIVSRAVKRDTAERLAEKRSNERLEALGKGPKINDKRRLFLLNEGRVLPGSKLSEIIPKAEMQIREQSYKLRKTQLQKNPSLHLSMTRLAIRNLPRAMDEKALKALGRKAVVQFATEVREQKRQPLTKEEVLRSMHYQDSLGEESTSSKKHGVVRQSKIIQEQKGSGKTGRSRGYGFLEMRNHKAALMALRWLNAHPVSKEEIDAGDGDTPVEPESRRRLVVEFAIENAQVVKRQREKQYRAKEKSLKRKAEEEAQATAAAAAEQKQREADESAAETKQGNAMIGRKRKNKKLKRS